MFDGHYKRLISCSFFIAPRTPVKPGTVKPRVEYIEIITGGVIWHRENGVEKEYRKGAIFWHQAGERTIFKTSPDDPYRCLACQIETDGSPRQFARCGCWGTTPDLDSFVEDMLYLNSCNLLQTESVFTYFMGTLLRQMLPAQLTGLPSALRRACRLIERDPVRELSVDEIAAASGVSKSRLFTLFKVHLNSSPHHYLLSRRIALAKDLLSRRGNIPIKQIAEICGFKTIEIFYRRFRQYTGVTTGTYREKHSC